MQAATCLLKKERECRKKVKQKLSIISSLTTWPRETFFFVIISLAVEFCRYATVLRTMQRGKPCRVMSYSGDKKNRNTNVQMDEKMMLQKCAHPSDPVTGGVATFGINHSHSNSCYRPFKVPLLHGKNIQAVLVGFYHFLNFLYHRNMTFEQE